MGTKSRTALHLELKPKKSNDLNLNSDSGLSLLSNLLKLLAQASIGDDEDYQTGPSGAPNANETAAAATLRRSFAQDSRHRPELA